MNGFQNWGASSQSARGDNFEECGSLRREAIARQPFTFCERSSLCLTDFISLVWYLWELRSNWKADGGQGWYAAKSQTCEGNLHCYGVHSGGKLTWYSLTAFRRCDGVHAFYFGAWVSPRAGQDAFPAAGCPVPTSTSRTSTIRLPTTEFGGSRAVFLGP